MSNEIIEMSTKVSYFSTAQLLSMTCLLSYNSFPLEYMCTLCILFIYIINWLLRSPNWSINCLILISFTGIILACMFCTLLALASVLNQKHYIFSTHTQTHAKSSEVWIISIPFFLGLISLKWMVASSIPMALY